MHSSLIGKVEKANRYARELDRITIERCELVEVSTPELDDVIRLEDDFGREGTNAP